MTPLLAPGLRPDRSFERIYRRHVGDVYRYALAVLRNPSDAEDVTQTTFLNAYRAFQRGERPRQAQNWLIAIAHNVCRQRFRQATRRPQEVALDENAAEWLEDEDRGPSADDLRRGLSHLAFNQRAALVMRELEGRSYAEIAEILGLSVSAVETLIFRARRALREQLEGTLTCAEAERALSLEADGRLPRAEKGPLRAHLRECAACATLARSQRAQRSAWKALGALPVPASLTSLFGGGTAAIGVKAAAVTAGALMAGGLGYAGDRLVAPHQPTKARPKTHLVRSTPQVSHVAPAAPAHVVRRLDVPAAAPTPKRHEHGHALPKTPAAKKKHLQVPRSGTPPKRAKHERGQQPGPAKHARSTSPGNAEPHSQAKPAHAHDEPVAKTQRQVGTAGRKPRSQARSKARPEKSKK